MIDSTGYLFKLDINGQLIYKVPYGIEWTGSYPGTRGTPVVADDKIYMVSGRGKLVCFNNEKGSILWSREFFSEFGGKNIVWGINETPVVDGDVIYATPGGPEFNIVALNRHSGELIWNCRGEGEVSAYCNPLLYEHNGRKILSTYTASHLMGLDAATGELLWSEDRPSEWSVHPSTPIYHEGEMYYLSGYNSGGGKLKMNEDGTSVSVVWENHVNDFRYGAVLVDGYIYESFGEGEEFGWRCVDWKTGEEMFLSDEFNPGPIICADGMIYCYTLKGELLLVSTNHEKFDVVSQARVKQGNGVHIAYPVIDDGVLYVRHGNVLISYKI
jgi:outer membrane protein assembly factor BamB